MRLRLRRITFGRLRRVLTGFANADRGATVAVRARDFSCLGSGGTWAFLGRVETNTAGWIMASALRRPGPQNFEQAFFGSSVEVRIM